MSKRDNNWQYVEQYPVEPEFLTDARRTSLELGVEPVGRGTAAFLSSLALSSRAENILELGTGVGVSGLSLLRNVTKTTLTTIDIEPEFQAQAKRFYLAAGIQAPRFRLISGDATQIMPRFNRSAYDLILLDADPESLLDYVEEALLIVRPGGTIVIPHALRGGLVADPTARDQLTVDMRDLLSAVSDSPAIVPALMPLGDGVLTLTRTQQSG